MVSALLTVSIFYLRQWLNMLVVFGVGPEAWVFPLLAEVQEIRESFLFSSLPVECPGY